MATLSLSKQHPFLSGFESSSHVWCLHCERVWPKSKWIASNWYCPSDDCLGTPMDAIAWDGESLNELNRPDRPPYPAPGFFWPLYPVFDEKRPLTF